MAQRIVWGSLDLTADPYLWEYGGDFGAGSVVSQALQQQLQDGEIVSSSRTSNRELSLTVLLDASDLDALAAAEAALVAEAGKQQNVLIFYPGDGHGVPTVFDTFVAQVTFQRDDDRERANLRQYLLTIPAAPFPRSLESVTETIPAPSDSDPVTPTVTEVDSCDYASSSAASAAGWSGYDSRPPGTGSVSAMGSYIQMNPTGTAGYFQWGLKRTFSSPLSSPGYLIVDAFAVGATDPISFYVNNALVAPAATSGTKYWIPASGPVSSLIVITGADYAGGPVGSAWLAISDVSATDLIGSASLTQHQVLRQFSVRGSARTPAAISIRGVDPSTGDDAALGQTLVYTTKTSSIPGPALRPYRADGPTEVTDGTAYSGKNSSMTSQITLKVPVASFASAGYLLVARVKASTAGAKSVSWAIGSSRDGTSLLPGATGGSTPVTIAAANTWQLVTLAKVVLPPGLAGSLATVYMGMTGSADLTLDDAWIFDLDHGQVTILDAGTDTRVWLDAATLNLPVPTIWQGTAADRTDAYVPSDAVMAAGAHEVAPPVVNIFVAAGSPPEVGLTYYPRWHTHAATVS